MKDLTLVTYTHTDCSDVWPAYFGQCKKHLPKDLDHVVLVNDIRELPKDMWCIWYDDDKTYTERLLQGLEQIESEYIILCHEDFILIDDIDEDAILEYISYLNEFPVTGWIKLIKGGTGPFIKVDDRLKLFYNAARDYTVAVQPTIWRRDVLIDLIRWFCPRVNIWDFERVGTKEMNNSSTEIALALTAYRGGDKRGMMHWDSNIWPFIATAVVKGKWNTLEYPVELAKIFSEYDIDPAIRGENR